jgi:hypothetical protein
MAKWSSWMHCCVAGWTVFTNHQYDRCKLYLMKDVSTPRTQLEDLSKQYFVLKIDPGSMLKALNIL